MGGNQRPWLSVPTIDARRDLTSWGQGLAWPPCLVIHDISVPSHRHFLLQTWVAHVLKMGDGRSRFQLPLEVYAPVVGPPRLLVEWEEDEAVLPRHSTPVRWGRMATWPYCYCWPPLPLKPEELWWHSCALVLIGMMSSLAALGPRMSIGISIMVTPFIDILAARLLLFLLEELPSDASHSLHHEPPSHGFGVVPLTSARLERLLFPSVSGGSFPRPLFA